MFGLVPLEADAKTQDLVRRLAVDAFTAAANNGLPFQQCLAVVMGTGMKIAVDYLPLLPEPVDERPEPV